MPVNGKALLEAAAMLAEVEEMRVTVKNTFTASAVTALAGTGGFLLLGPAGLLVGSTVAGLGAYSYSKNKFKPVFAILKEDLRPQQQQRLIDLLRKAFDDLHPMDAMKLIAFMMNHQEIWVKVRNIVTAYMLEYFMTELSVNNVNVEVKEMTDLEKYRKFTEEFKREHGITGVARPPAIEPAVDGKANMVCAAPGWRADFTATSAGGASGLAFPDASASPLLADEASLSTDQLDVSAGSAYSADDPQSLEDDALLPRAPRTTLRTTF